MLLGVCCVYNIPNVTWLCRTFFCKGTSTHRRHTTFERSEYSKILFNIGHGK